MPVTICIIVANRILLLGRLCITCVIVQVAPAIDVALQKVNSHSPSGATSHWTFPGFNLTVSYADSYCDSAESLNHAIEFYMTGKVGNADTMLSRAYRQLA